MSDDDAPDRGNDRNDRGDDGTDPGDVGADRGVPGNSGSGDGGQGRGFHVGIGLGLLSGVFGGLLDRSDRSFHRSPLSPGHRETPGFRRRRQNTEPRSGSERTDWEGRGESADYLFDTRLDDSEFVVTADIPGATTDDLSVGIRQRTNDLLISREGTLLERIDIPWASPEATRVWLNNGVLVVRLRPRDT